ncbi:hypothetical protein EI94DRAFT_1696126 [Lactarius quietus]|nr:hypothetical protein EI94DRAFT_1696126 [Lactarius quietus]
MAPNKKKAKKAATHGRSDLLGSDWLIHSSKGSDYPDDSDYPSNDSDYPDYMEEDDADSRSDQCLLVSGDEQTMAEGRARAHALAAKCAAKKKALAAKLAAKMNKSNDGKEAAEEDSIPSEAANEDYPPADEDATPSEVANGGVMEDFDREIIEKLVHRHLHSRRRRGKKTPNFHKIWSYTDIVIDFHWEEIDKLAAEMSSAKAGSPAYLGCYKRAIETINDQLDEETRAKLMEKHGQSTLWDFSATMYNQFGVRVIVLAGNCDGDGEPTVMLYDINDKMGGTSFKEFHKQWKSDPLVDDYLKWTADSFGVQPRNGSQDDGKNKENPKNIKLPMNRHGYLVLPSWEAINQEGATYKKLLIGKFMTQLYSGSKWQQGKNPMGKTYLPNGITLTQYHHICVEDADALLKHWTQRQAAGEIPFWFKNSVNTNRHGKKVSVNANTSDSVGPRDQSEGILKDSQENQERVGHGASQGGGEGSSKQVPGRQGRGDTARNSRKSFPHTSDKRPAKAAKARKELPTEEDGGDDMPTVKSQESPRKCKKNNGAAAAMRPSKRQKVGEANVQLKPQRLSHPQQPAEWVKEVW